MTDAEACDDWVKHLRANLGPPPRAIAPEFAKYLSAPVIRRWNAQPYLNSWDQLWTDGLITLGAVVMANSALFENQPKKNRDAPGLVVYCADPGIAVPPAELQQIANALYQIYERGTSAPDCQHLARVLKQDDKPTHGEPVPPSISPHYPCKISSLLYKRDHFPLITLAGGWVPILHHPGANGIVRMVPSKYWPQSIVAEWERRSRSNLSVAQRPSVLVRFPLVLFAAKILIVSCFLLSLGPSTWRYLQLSEPLPQRTAKELAEIPVDEVFRFSGNLDVSQAEHARKNIYFLPVTGTDRQIWIEQKARSEDDLPIRLDNKVVTKRRPGWLDYRFTDCLASNKGAPVKEPVFLLDTLAAPTTGMKIWRIACLLVPLLLIWFISKWLLSLLRGR